MKMSDNMKRMINDIYEMTENINLLQAVEELAEVSYLTGAEDVLKVVNQHIREQLETRH